MLQNSKKRKIEILYLNTKLYKDGPSPLFFICNNFNFDVELIDEFLNQTNIIIDDETKTIINNMFGELKQNFNEGKGFLNQIITCFNNYLKLKKLYEKTNDIPFDNFITPLRI